jgi:transcriptional regulator with XRE-family HTH domain
MTANREPVQTTSREAVVADNVRSLREAAGLSLAGLSELVAKMGHDLSDQVIGSIETSRRRIRIDDLLALGEALGVPYASLLHPDAGPGVLHEIVFEGGITERVAADDYEIDEKWISFRMRDQVVYAASCERVLGIRILPNGGES